MDKKYIIGAVAGVSTILIIKSIKYIKYVKEYNNMKQDVIVETEGP